MWTWLIAYQSPQNGFHLISTMIDWSSRWLEPETLRNAECGLLGAIQKKIRFEPKQTETRSVSVVFWIVSRNQKTLIRVVSVCFDVSDRYRNNQNKQNFLETNRKNLQKMFSIRGPPNRWFFFSVWTKTNRNSICFGCFLVCFGSFVSMFRTGVKTTETNKTYGMGN